MSSINLCDVIEDVHTHPVPDINVAKLTGIYKAFEIANDDGLKKIKIRSDSKISIALIKLISVDRAKVMRSKKYSKCPDIIEGILRLSKISHLFSHPEVEYMDKQVYRPTNPTRFVKAAHTYLNIRCLSSSGNKLKLSRKQDTHF